MKIAYRILVDGIERNPIWPESLTKEYSMETSQQFFRSRLNGSFTFTNSDYDFLFDAPFDSIFEFKLQKLSSLGVWEDYFEGSFTKVDATWNADDRTVVTQITPSDEYTELLAGYEKEYNLIDLAPAKTRMRFNRRPFLQIYVPGESVIGCFLGGMDWEQEIPDPVLNETTLVNTYFFKRNTDFFIASVTNIDGSLDVSDDYSQTRDFDGSVFTEPADASGENEVYQFKEFPGPIKATCSTSITLSPLSSGNINITYKLYTLSVPVLNTDNVIQVGEKIRDAINADSTIQISCTFNGIDTLVFKEETAGLSGNGNTVTLDPNATDTEFSSLTPEMTGGSNSGFGYAIIRNSDLLAMYVSDGFLSRQDNNTFTMTADPFSGHTGTIEVSTRRVSLYARYVLDVEVVDIGGFEFPTEPIPIDDIVPNNRNYNRVLGYDVAFASIINKSSVSPTKFGLRPDDKYYAEQTEGGLKYFPIGRSQWGLTSLWFRFSSFDSLFEERGRKAFELKDSYLLGDAIQALLSEIDPTITHLKTSEYSDFLYSETNPLGLTPFSILLSQKSNILAGEYDQPAQRAPVRFRDLMEMIRDCYGLYWFIEAGKLKIEHIKYFKNGGSYSTAPSIGIDLTTLPNPRPNQFWGFNTSNWDYDKQEIPERIEFEWMDESTLPFKGYPIETISVYSNRGSIDQRNIGLFSSDIDFMLTSPESISQDGFALFAATFNVPDGIYELPFVEKDVGGANLRIQNFYASFLFLHEFLHIWDLPARTVKINGIQTTALGVKRGKKQSVDFPISEDPGLFNLIKTYIGNGEIEKLSINLSSRICSADLKYDTDE